MIDGTGKYVTPGIIDVHSHIGVYPAPGDKRLFYHQNMLGSVMALTDTTGKVVEGYQYDAYGRQWVDKPGPNGVVDWGGDDVITAGGRSAGP